MEYDKFQSILLEHFIELKPLIFEECILKFLFVVMNFFHPFVNFVETRVCSILQLADFYHLSMKIHEIKLSSGESYCGM